jgi:glycosyltransferase involved in cell wall biosynthesis
MKDDLCVLIGTRNRYNQSEGIPLIWAFDSIKNQSYKSDVLIADDNSEEEQSKKIKDKCIEYGFRYIKSNKKLGCSGIRRYALDFIDSPWHLILDDDSIFYNEKTLEKIIKSLDKIQSKKTGAIIYPAYNRIPFPTSFVPLSKIGKINMQKGVNSWFLTSFPEEWISLFEENSLIPIELGGSYGIYNTKRLKEIGGFRSEGKNDYAMESELVWRLRMKGYNVFYSPDQEKACLHLKFGVTSSISPEQIIKSLSPLRLERIESLLKKPIKEMLNQSVNGRDLQELIKLSNCFDYLGGCREISERNWIEDKISNEFGQIVKYYPFFHKLSGGISYIQRSIRQAKEFKISRRDSLNLSCNINKKLNQKAQFLSIFMGLVGGLYKGVKWSIKKP